MQCETNKTKGRKTPVKKLIYVRNPDIFTLAEALMERGIVKKHKSLSSWVSHLVENDLRKRGAAIRKAGLKLPESLLKAS